MSEIQITQTNRIQANPLGTEPVGQLLRRFAVPSIVAMLVNALYNMVDQIFIGHSIGISLRRPGGMILASVEGA